MTRVALVCWAGSIDPATVSASGPGRLNAARIALPSATG
jgi:hypothetical protein